MDYPIKIFPQSISAIDVLQIEKIELNKLMDEYERKLSKPNQPFKPVEPTKKKYNDYYINRNYNGAISTIIIVTIINIIALLIFLFGADYLFLMPFVSLFFSYHYLKDTGVWKDLSNHEEYIIEMKQANEDYKREVAIFNKKLAQFDSDVEKYQNEMTLYNSKISNYRTKLMMSLGENLKTFLGNRIKDSLKSSKVPDVTSTFVKKGISENYFKNHLINYFGSTKIFLNRKLAQYYPDFVYFDSDNNLYVDIEIDEPYVGASKEVIHFYDSHLNIYSDKDRNDFFSSNGWGIIRFSERQIFTFPTECCKELEDFVNSICHFQSVEYFLKTKNYVPVEKIWNRTTADEMALFDYRKTYLTDHHRTLFE